MPSTSTNYSLALYNNTTDASEIFEDYRDDMMGTGAGSNMNLIDSAIGTLEADVRDLLDRTALTYVSATQNSSTDYGAVSDDITSYRSGQYIILSVDDYNTASVTLNINGLGSVSIMKVDKSTGTYENLEHSELMPTRYYICRYDGTRWILLSNISGDQFTVPSSTAGNFLNLDANYQITDSGKDHTDYVRLFVQDAGTFDTPDENYDSNSGYRVGDMWIDALLYNAWIALDVSVGAAVWTKLAYKTYLSNIRTYSLSGEIGEIEAWSKPSNLSHIVVEVVGGGGGGGGVNAVNGEAGVGAGGGGGGYSKKYIPASSLGVTETVTIGEGGAGGTAGNNDGEAGNTSSFGSHLSATGGNGGNGSGSFSTFPQAGVVVAGAGGSGSGGDINQNGGRGEGGILFSSSNVLASRGGSSFYAPQTYRTSTGSVDGRNGLTYGGGGSGGQNAGSTTDRKGGDGAGGIVIVYEYTYNDTRLATPLS